MIRSKIKNGFVYECIRMNHIAIEQKLHRLVFNKIFQKSLPIFSVKNSN